MRRTLSPHPDTPQEDALASDADVVIAGGANGGGKTWGLCYSALQPVQDPDYYGVIFRRTYPQLERSIEKETRRMYPLAGGEYNKSKHLWTFPSGAEIKLAHLQYEGDEDDWDGAELTFIGFDQVEQFTRRQFFFLASRLRNPQCDWTPWMYATCNPPDSNSHWLYEFITPWLDDEDTYPVDAKRGTRRWFFGERDGWRWVDEGDTETIETPDGDTVEAAPKSVEFHPSTVFDNPTLLQNEPGYVQELNTLQEDDRLRKLHGAWGVDANDSPLSGHQIQSVDPDRIPDGLKWVRYWDLADTDAANASSGSSYTAGVRAAICQRLWTICGYGDEQGDETCRFWAAGSVDGDQCPECGRHSLQTDTMDVLIVSDATWFQLTGHAKETRIQERAHTDGTDTWIYFEQEPGATGKEAIRDYRQSKIPDRFKVIGDKPTGDKMTRLQSWVSLAETGRIWVPDGAAWGQDFIDALEQLDPQDVVDAVSGAYARARKRYRRGGW